MSDLDDFLAGVTSAIHTLGVEVSIYGGVGVGVDIGGVGVYRERCLPTLM